MKKRLRSVSLVFTLFLFTNSFSQSGCPAVDAGADIYFSCNQTCTTLRAVPFAGFSCDSYTVNQIPYNPPYAYDMGNPILVNIDDVWSDTIDLPFNFCYFGVNYDKIVVGANGLVSFNLNNASTNATLHFVSWQINGPIPANFPGDLKNTIMTPWQDIDPTYSGSTYYQITGTYPCRQFVVSWYQVPYYGDSNSVWHADNPDSLLKCPNPLYATQQVVFYEVTNVIEMYIQNKEVCSGWNGGLAIEGINDATGTNAYWVPGRNATQWTAQNDAWRFTPAGTLNVAVSWYDSTALISSSDMVDVCPSAEHTYTAQAIYTNSDGSTTTVTDNVIVGFSQVSVQVDSTHQPLCYGDSSGSVYASISVMHSEAQSFGWTPGGTDSLSLINIPAGAYTFTLTDTASCTYTQSVTLTYPPQLMVTVSDSTVTTCFNLTGALTANVSGGDTTGGSYSYLWSPGNATTDTISGIAYGNYVVTVTDMHGCIATDTGTFKRNGLAPVIDTAVITNVSCFGGNNGSIALAITDAFGPTTFTWIGSPINNDTLVGLTAATYYLAATNTIFGCVTVDSFNVSQPTAIAIGSPSITPESCTSGGTITGNASGGTGTLIYNWSNGDTGTIADSLIAGTYMLTVTDQNLCTVTASYNVASAMNPPAFGNPVITNVSCNEGNDGKIVATITGGTPPITITWSNGTTGDTDSNLVVGCYGVTATDGSGCATTASYCVTEPAPLAAGQATITQATCIVGGTISVTTATGGTSPYTYGWSNGDTGTFADSLAGGPVTLTITDQNSCSITALYTIPSAPGTVSFGTPQVFDANCPGDSAGGIIASASGGTGTIRFHWSNNDSTSSIFNLAAGTYSVTITDSVGCSASTSYTVSEPPAFVVTFTSPVLICINTQGYACVLISGGSPPYSYQWSNFSDSTCAVDLFPGKYSVTVMDWHECSVVDSVTIATAPDYVPTSIVKSFPCSSTPYGNDSIVVVGGIAPFTFSIAGVGTDTTGVFNNLPPGNYTWTVYDSLGCSKSSVFTIPQSAANDVYGVAADSTSCFGSADGSVTITPQSSNGPYLYSLNGGNTQSSNVFDSLQAGAYSITAFNKYGCSVALTVTVGEPVADGYDVLTDSVSCFGFSDGAIMVTALSGNGPYTYSLNGGAAQSSGVWNNLAAGTNTIVATNNNGCSVTLTAIVGEPEKVTADIQPDTVVTSPGVDNQVTVVVQHFSNPVYSWSPVGVLSCDTCANPTVNVSNDTVFYVMVSEAQSSGCKAADSVVVIIKQGDFRMPNAFTPNGDNKNDKFGPVFNGEITVKEFRIYNRWGAAVHNGTDNWDGTFEGKAQPAGTYAYYIMVEVPDKNNPVNTKATPKQGSFTLIR